MSNLKGARSLTEIEYLGLQGSCSLADGHAYHNLPDHLSRIIDNLPEIWRNCISRSIPEIEAEFSYNYAVAAGSKYLEKAPNVRISPTASNSIDLVGAWLHSRNIQVALIEPTFDNLALLLRRRGVPLLSMRDHLLYEALAADTITDYLLQLRVEAIFLVNPNNPTGSDLNEYLFKKLVNACAQLNIILLIDNTFRFYRRKIFDDYQILSDAGVSFICIEDTGKTWPTLDMKASILCYSDDIAQEMATIYDEVYLCSSPFTLSTLSNIIKETVRFGLKDSVWNLIDERRALIRHAIRGLPLKVDDQAQNSTLSVEWLRCTENYSDLQMASKLESIGIVVLPGRHFYWSSSDKAFAQKNIRISFLKKQATFDFAINRLNDLQKETKDYAELARN